MQFWLGTHSPPWLRKTDVPLFISRRRLACRSRLPRAKGPWALDSSAFSELSLHGRWTITPKGYTREVRRYADCVGKLAWAAPMDWCCEPFMLRKTGLSVEEHQRRTLDNYLELMTPAPDLPWVPVLQGWTIGDSWRHAEAYQHAGVRLAELPLVGLGSVCRRQDTTRARALVATLHDMGIRNIHGFGFKVRGLAATAHHLASADSLAWSLRARKSPPLPGCDHPHCNNCLRFALAWRERVLNVIGVALEKPVHLDLGIWGEADSERPAQRELFP